MDGLTIKKNSVKTYQYIYSGNNLIGFLYWDYKKHKWIWEDKQ